MPVQIATVASAKLRESSEYLSTLRSRRSVRIQPQVEGWVTEIEVDAGARVEPGATLMRIDSRRQLATVRGQAATISARWADLAYWKQQHRRLTLLQRSGGASKQEVEQARASMRSADAAVQAQHQQVRAAEVELRYYRVTAPEAGTVGDIPVRVGDLVTPQTLLTTIDQNELLEAYIAVPVEQAARIRPDVPVEILEQPDRPATTSRISFVAPHVSSDQTVLVKSQVDNQAGQFRNAQLVRARVIWSERDGPAVPVLAVQTLNGQTFVWTVKDGPQGGLVADQRAIQVGPIVDQRHPVLRGLTVGDRVIVGGMQKLQRGAPVVSANADAGSKGKAR